MSTLSSSSGGVLRNCSPASRIQVKCYNVLIEIKKGNSRQKRFRRKCKTWKLANMAKLASHLF
jgi:hypothetical protein